MFSQRNVSEGKVWLSEVNMEMFSQKVAGKDNDIDVERISTGTRFALQSYIQRFT